MRYTHEVNFRFKGDLKKCKPYMPQARQMLSNLIEISKNNLLNIEINQRLYTLAGGVTIFVKLTFDDMPVVEIYVPIIKDKKEKEEPTSDFIGILSYGHINWTTGITASSGFTYTRQGRYDSTIQFYDETGNPDGSPVASSSALFYPHVPVIDDAGHKAPFISVPVEKNFEGDDLAFKPNVTQQEYQPGMDPKQFQPHGVSIGFLASVDSSRRLETGSPLLGGNTDWIGKDGTVLTWNAPPGRCLEGRVATGNISYPDNRAQSFPEYHNIYYDGEVLFAAPGHVSGATIHNLSYIDDNGQKQEEKWLIIACHVFNGHSDYSDYFTQEFSFFARKIPSTYEHTDWEREVWRLCNIEREKVGLPGYYLIPTENNVARDWCDSMATTDILDHGDTVARLTAYYDSFNFEAENLLQAGWSSNITPQQAVDAWMASTDHKANILYNIHDSDRIGGQAGMIVGKSTFESAGGWVYACIDFIQPAKQPPGFGQSEWISGGTFIYDDRILYHNKNINSVRYYKGVQPCFFNPTGDKAITQSIKSGVGIFKTEIEFDFSLLKETIPSFTFNEVNTQLDDNIPVFAFDYNSAGNIVSARIEVTGSPPKGDNIKLNVNGTIIPSSWVNWWHVDGGGETIQDEVNLEITTIYPLLYLDPRYSLAAWIEIYGTNKDIGSGSVKYNVTFDGITQEIASFPASHIMDVTWFTRTSVAGFAAQFHGYHQWDYFTSYSWLQKGWYGVGVDRALMFSQSCAENVFTFWKNDQYFYTGIENGGKTINNRYHTSMDNVLIRNRDELGMADNYISVDDPDYNPGDEYDPSSEKYPFDSGSPGEIKAVNCYNFSNDVFTEWNLGYNNQEYRLVKDIAPYSNSNSLNIERKRISDIVITVDKDN